MPDKSLIQAIRLPLCSLTACIGVLAAVLFLGGFNAFSLPPAFKRADLGYSTKLELSGHIHAQKQSFAVDPIQVGNTEIRDWCQFHFQPGYDRQSLGSGMYQKWEVNPITGEKLRRIGEPFRSEDFTPGENDVLVISVPFNTKLIGKTGTVHLIRDGFETKFQVVFANHWLDMLGIFSVIGILLSIFFLAAAIDFSKDSRKKQKIAGI